MLLDLGVILLCHVFVDLSHFLHGVARAYFVLLHLIVHAISFLSYSLYIGHGVVTTVLLEH